MTKEEKKETFNISKEKDFSNWYTEIVKRAELADIESGVKGFLVFQPWSVLSMEKMFQHMESVLQRKAHKPYFYPTLIPEKNFHIEANHVKGFTPQVFWVTHAGKNKLEERYALRPTSETVFYKMFSKWIESYNQLPFKTYQRANVFRYETKATRPFLRSREFHWIETHCAHKDESAALAQVHEDMETTQEVLHDIFGIPFIFFERPDWDKFPGAQRTFAADALNPDGRVIQQPSTHIINENFSKGFKVNYTDKNEKEQLARLTCYGPAISRIFASVVITHGDDKGLKFPWKIAPLQVIIVPIAADKDKNVILTAKKLKAQLQENNITVDIDADLTKRPGEKFFYWEMKGVPLRIELGPKEIKEKKLTLYRRDTDKKETISEKDLIKYIEKTSKAIDTNLIKKADEVFKGRIQNAKSKEEIQKLINDGKIARINFCSCKMDGAKCAEVVEKDIGAEVRGTQLKKEKPTGNCIFCKKKAKEVVYIAKSY
ncbi:MAG: proline--tRNA ligase [Nanoarchaeota archaeon]|nr:proline--tRNA ligase [Nanoarchaeota archaeon]